MRWSKIKNIIILLLVVVNVCLLAMVGLRAGRTARNERETREQMRIVLERNGIAFLPEEMPGEMPLTTQRINLTFPGQTQAAVLLGALTEIRETSSLVTYTGERGVMNVSTAGGELEASFTDDAWPLNGGDPGRSGAKLLETLGVTVEEAERETKGDTVTLRCVQLWDGAPVPDMALTLSYTGGSLKHLSGRLLLGTAEPVAGEGPITAATALPRFLEGLNQEGYVCSQISRMYAGYAAGGAGSVSLTPTWYLETDAWPWRFGVNALTGAVTAAE